MENDLRRWIDLMEAKRPVKPVVPVAPSNAPQMGLAELRRLCMGIVGDIEMLAEVASDPELTAQKTRLQQSIKTSLDRITAYCIGTRKNEIEHNDAMQEVVQRMGYVGIRVCTLWARSQRCRCGDGNDEK
ncbi:unnamed protein product [Sphagnum tenellum]